MPIVMKRIILVLYICLMVASVQAETCYLLSFKAAKAPVVRRGIVYYTADLTFDTVPGHYWVRYNQSLKAIEIDCYGVTCVYPFKGIEPHILFKSLSVTTAKTTFALNAQESKIAIGIDEGWKCSGRTLDAATIRIMVWQELAQAPTALKNNNMVYLYIGSGLLAALLVIGVGLLIKP